MMKKPEIVGAGMGNNPEEMKVLLEHRDKK